MYVFLFRFGLHIAIQTVVKLRQKSQYNKIVQKVSFSSLLYLEKRKGYCTKKKFPINDIFSKRDQTADLVKFTKRSLMENFIFWSEENLLKPSNIILIKSKEKTNDFQLCINSFLKFLKRHYHFTSVVPETTLLRDRL